MRVENLKVYDLEECLIASGYPMKTKIGEELELSDKDVKRANRLINAMAVDNNAHGQFLSGILVAFDVTFTNKAWVEAERYKFLTFDSSQSTMHRISKFEIKESCNEYVTENTISEVERLKDIYNENPTPENYLTLLYNVPSGFELTARLNTNYRCLMNIYIQRHNHRLPEWREFCEYIRTNLPMFDEFMTTYEIGRGEHE